MLETLLAGEAYRECPPEQCYEPDSLLPIALVNVRRPRCCVAKQTRQRSIVGGRFSLTARAAEGVVDAADFYNPTCIDSTFQVYYINLMIAAVGDEIRKQQRSRHASDPCGGLCLPEVPVCKQLRPRNTSLPHPDFAPGGLLEGTICRSEGFPSRGPCPRFDTGYSCTVPSCIEDVAPFCARDSLVGVRARQVRPEADD